MHWLTKCRQERTSQVQRQGGNSVEEILTCKLESNHPQAAGKLETARSRGQGLAGTKCDHDANLPQGGNSPFTSPAIAVGRATSEGPSLQVPVKENHSSIMCAIETGAEVTVMLSEVY
ncbi:hypothetical protein AOLI_G00131850 [Acnodon oligacanthus]